MAKIYNLDVAIKTKTNAINLNNTSKHLIGATLMLQILNNTGKRLTGTTRGITK